MIRKENVRLQEMVKDREITGGKMGKEQEGKSDKETVDMNCLYTFKNSQRSGAAW